MTSQGYLLDTDYVIDFLKGKDYTRTFLQTALVSPQVEKPSQVRFDISIITYAEVYEGIYYGHNRTRHEEGFREFLHGITVFGITRSVARQFAIIRGDLRAKGQLIGQSDLLIGATAIHHNLTLVTRNLKDYNRIPHLQLSQPG